METIPSRDMRTRVQAKCDREAALGLAAKAARRLIAGMKQLDRGRYAIEPGDVLALRTALERAERFSRERSST